MESAKDPGRERERPAWLRDELGNPTGKGIRIGVVDSGRDPEWEEPRIRKGIGLVDPHREFAVARSPDDRDRIGHGTACADVILELAPEVEIYPIRVFDVRLETSVELSSAALEWAVEHRMHVVNLSLGTLIESSLRPFYRACELTRQAGVVIVAAVNLATGWSYPAVFENAIGVQAGRFRNAFDFEYRADEAVECIAQGECEVRWLGARRKSVFGSSFAAPHISAIVALLLERFPNAGLEQIRDLLARYGCSGGS